jgi:hypothetical protein
MQYTDPVMTQLEAAQKTTSRGVDYWKARSIQQILGYATWDKFTNVIEKAIQACDSAGTDNKHHFSRTGNMVEIGSGAKREEEDFFLSRYGAYLVAMNGDSSKPEVAAAQTYFAVQTRRQELADKQERMVEDVEKRMALRQRLTDATKHLNSAARQAGVQSYALFAHAGYLGLYGMSLKEIKAKKGIGEKEQLFDRAGRLELSANEFRANLTEKSLLKNKVQGEENANREHRRIGGIVRQTIHKEAGILPEDLPAEPSIKKLAAKTKAAKQLPPAPEP